MSVQAADGGGDIALQPGGLADTVTVDGGEADHFLPITGSFATRDWFYRSAATPPLTGRHRFRQRICGADAAYVLSLEDVRILLTREGLLFTDLPADLKLSGPPGLRRDGETFYLAEASLAAAPVLPGAYACVPEPATHPLLRGVLPMILMAPHLPPGTRWLEPLPAPALLALFGLEATATARLAAPLCGLETLIWTDARDPIEIGAALVRTARDLAHQVQPPPATRRRICFTSGVAEPDALAGIARRFAFEIVEAPPHDPKARAALFAGAEAILAPQVEWLEYLLFCAAGCQVVELVPDTAWHGVYAGLSDRLGLIHAVLPCAAEDDLLRPDPAGLRRLLRILQARR